MEAKKYYNYLFLFLLFMYSCNKKNDDFFYLEDLAKDIKNHNYTSKYNFSDFYILCQNNEYFKKISYKEIYNDFYSKKDTNLTTEKYLSDLFNNKIQYKGLDSIYINKKILNLHNKGNKVFIDYTSYPESDSTRILKNEITTISEVETVLYLYSKMGYQINNNDYLGLTILYKK
ncbi:hypothetical protein SAMN05443634_106112 [Chishuiella changwenlii]|nr:hypothetical protein [Chishuiella changwenlii]SHL13900.1 hypothetical protein SAMN05443634_106112 [Chishuiella changwenlii]